MTVGGEGRSTPATEGETHDVVTITSANDPVRILSPAVETGSYALRAWNTTQPVFIGWDEDVGTDDGFPLEAGDVISFEMDNSEQQIWAVSAEAGAEVRVIATN